MVDIFVGGMPPVHNNPHSGDQRRGTPRKKSRKIREKRQNQADRRESVREGIVVTLSYKKERRSGLDRRKK